MWNACLIKSNLPQFNCRPIDCFTFSTAECILWRLTIFLGVRIVKNRRSVTVTSDFGLTVKYDGTYNVFIEASGQYNGNLLGLCGNFNGRKCDDFTTKDGHVVKNAVTFGNSWKVNESCPNAIYISNPCNSNTKLKRLAQKKCSSLWKWPFRKCNSVLKPNIAYIYNCQYDVCACNGNPTACACEAYAAYSEDCAHAGVIFNWRNNPKFAECTLQILKNLSRFFSLF